MKQLAGCVTCAFLFILILTTCAVAGQMPGEKETLSFVELGTGNMPPEDIIADEPNPNTTGSLIERVLAEIADFSPPDNQIPQPTPQPTPQSGNLFHIPPDYFFLEPVPTPQPTPTPPRPMIALTFDDGPSRFTEMILDTLESYNARATFCVLGYRINTWESTIRRAVNTGSEIIGHSWNHTDMTTQNRANIITAIQAPDNAIYEITGTRTRLFRPPLGARNNQVESIARELGFGILMWSIDPQDWREGNQTADHIYNWVMNQARDGSIVVLHDIYLHTALAMERLIPRLIADGFELVTVSELIAHHYGEIVPGEVYRGIR
jgi:peptidoglycan/xylan/chitin deacetylase (PgdA/CDA1 family)